MAQPIPHFIRLPRELTLKNIPQFLTPGIFAPEGTSLISVHSAQHELIEPVGLVALFATIAESVAKASGPLQLRMDKFKNIEYFQRMDFFNELGIEVSEKFDKWEVLGSAMPLKTVRRSEDLETTRNEIVDLIAKEQADKEYLHYFVAELLDNVFYHANSLIDPIVCGQSYPARNCTQIAVGDCGIGIRNSLWRRKEHRPHLTDDAAAILYGMKPRVSGYPRGLSQGPGGPAGFGLYVISKLVETVGGTLAIFSGKGRVIQEGATMTAFNDTYWRGTLVAVQLDTVKSPQTFREAMRKAREGIGKPAQKLDFS